MKVPILPLTHCLLGFLMPKDMPALQELKKLVQELLSHQQTFLRKIKRYNTSSKLSSIALPACKCYARKTETKKTRAISDKFTQIAKHKASGMPAAKRASRGMPWLGEAVPTLRRHPKQIVESGDGCSRFSWTTQTLICSASDRIQVTPARISRAKCVRGSEDAFAPGCSSPPHPHLTNGSLCENAGKTRCGHEQQSCK